jgi:hypothetical protein
LDSLWKESIETASAYRNNVRGEIDFTQKHETEENIMVVGSCPLILSVAVLDQRVVCLRAAEMLRQIQSVPYEAIETILKTTGGIGSSH